MKSAALPLATAISCLLAGLVPAAEPAQPAPAAAPPVAPTLHAGSPVTPEDLRQLEWIRGEAPADWEPGKLYILECWATWCGPCIAAIPKLNALHLKHHDKGLRIIGVNVWEDGIDKVREFVTARGEGMSYPIAYTGRGGAFETGWLTPAGVRGIPHAFVVREGTLLIKAHPSYLTDEVIAGLLDGGDAADEALASIDRQIRQREEISNALRSFNTAANTTRDVATMQSSLDAAIAAGADPAMIRGAHADLAIARSDWAALDAILAEITPEDPNSLIALHTILRRLDTRDEAPPTAIRSALAAIEPHIPRLPGPVELHTLANLEWRSGNRERALEHIQLATLRAADERNARLGVPAAFYERIAKGFAEGTPPSRETTSEWLREALQNRQPAPATAP
jgi:thiol-disulfide isomerase/thioredoxin